MCLVSRKSALLRRKTGTRQQELHSLASCVCVSNVWSCLPHYFFLHPSSSSSSTGVSWFAHWISHLYSSLLIQLSVSFCRVSFIVSLTSWLGTRFNSLFFFLSVSLVIFSPLSCTQGDFCCFFFASACISCARVHSFSQVYQTETSFFFSFLLDPCVWLK